jgi:hypothetical protein
MIGHMAADVAVATALVVPILIFGAVFGVRFEAGCSEAALIKRVRYFAAIPPVTAATCDGRWSAW